MIQQVQNTAESARAVHRLIEAMPTTMEDLEVIERRSQLIITKANIVRMAIADQTILDVAQYSPREISLIGLARGSTTLTLWFEGHPDPLIYLVKVIRDPNLDDQRRIDYGKLERKLAVLFPNSKVYLIPMSYKLIVRGQARDQEEAANILNIIQGEVINQDGSLLGNTANWGAAAWNPAAIADPYFNQVGAGGWAGGLWAGFIVNELRVPGEYQINLRWRVAELNRSQARNLGIDLAVLFNNGRHLLGTTMGGTPANLFGVFENGEIGVFVNWMATNGTATILTEPNVTVLSGRPARFLSGGEFAVPTVVGIAGAAGQTTTFRGYGTSVLVTPTVVDRDLIRLTTIAEFSQLNSSNTVNNIPGLNTRRVETTVELREGQTLALGGLLSHTKVTEVSRIPYLGDIPKIGPLLFSNKRSAMDETELLILVTPEIVRPMDAHEVPPVPGFETTYPTDHEFWKYNMTEGLPDTGYYQVPPYGSGAVGTNVGYQHFNPGPAESLYSPVPTVGGASPAPIGPTPMAAPPATAPPMTPIPAAPPPEAAPNLGIPQLQLVPPTPQAGNSAPLPAITAGPRMQPVSSPVRSSGAVRQAGYHSPPTASPQAIVPMNQATPTQGSSARIHRDQQRSSRY
jgi:pilus assembly protein CpaC